MPFCAAMKQRHVENVISKITKHARPVSASALIVSMVVTNNPIRPLPRSNSNGIDYYIGCVHIEFMMNYCPEHGESKPDDEPCCMLRDDAWMQVGYLREKLRQSEDIIEDFKKRAVEWVREIIELKRELAVFDRATRQANHEAGND